MLCPRRRSIGSTLPPPHSGAPTSCTDGLSDTSTHSCLYPDTNTDTDTDTDANTDTDADANTDANQLGRSMPLTPKTLNFAEFTEL